MTSERLPLGDHHTHAQDICFHNKESAKAFKINVGDHLYPDVPSQRYVDHVVKNNLDTIWLIYEDKKRFSLIREAISVGSPETKVKGFYFVRDPKKVDVKIIKDLYKKGFLHGIKIHPVIDNYPLSSENLDSLMKIAKQLNLPIIFHSDDRKKSMHLTSPEKQMELATTYPDVRLVIGHGGAYANPRISGENNTGAIGYWTGKSSRRAFIISALQLSMSKENVFYEFSIVTNKIKAKIISDFVNENPKVSGKILAGSDFPTLNARLDSQIEALAKAGLSRRHLLQVAANRL